jgi:hypothetical protein
MDEDFLHAVPEIERFSDVIEARYYVEAPPHWHVVLTDVRGSTKAIEAGRYRDVNALGVASIVALRNATPELELPYVFGGDGATLLIPESRRAVCESALRGVRKLAQSGFELELRVGMVAVSELKAAGHPVQVARFRASKHVRLAMLRGSGIAQAERWVKSPELGARYAVSSEGPDEANLEGFECRWQPVPSRRGHIVSLIVQALDASEEGRAASYRAIIATLEAALEGGGRPISAQRMRLGGVFGNYSTEARLRTGTTDGPAFRAVQANARKMCFLGRTLMALRVKAGGFDGKGYPQEVVENSDFRKFDEALRMVLDLSEDQLEVIEKELECARLEGHLVYGLHRAPSALITCYLRSFSNGDHVHFIDGADGGYALAARQLKAQLAERTRNQPPA